MTHRSLRRIGGPDPLLVAVAVTETRSAIRLHPENNSLVFRIVDR